MSREDGKVLDQIAILANTLVGITGIIAVWQPTIVFYWHPILMFLGLLCLSANAIVLVRMNRWFQVHVVMQILALISMTGGMIAIYLSKEEKGRPHWWTFAASWHAWAGALAYFIFAAISLSAFTSGIRKIKSQRDQHAQGGVVLFLLSDYVLVSGFHKLFQDATLYLFIFGMLVINVLVFQYRLTTGWRHLFGQKEVLSPRLQTK